MSESAYSYSSDLSEDASGRKEASLHDDSSSETEETMGGIIKPTETIEVMPLTQRMENHRGMNIDEHDMAWSDLQRALEVKLNLKDVTKSKGLITDEAQRRLLLFGQNVLLPPKGRNEIIEFLKAFSDLLIMLLFIGGALSFIAFGIDTTGLVNLYLGIVLFVVGVLSATVAYWGNRSATKIMATFKNMLPQQITVRRHGTERSIPAAELVVGDVVLVHAGDRVPADIRILQSNEFKVDNSSITGEAEAQLCTVESTHREPLETHNLAFSGTMAVSGTAIGIVIRTGQQSMIGVIAKLATATKTTKTPLAREVARFVRILGGLVLGLAIIFGVASGFVLKSWKFGILNTLGIVLSMPQGMPTTVTSMLSLAAKRLAGRNVLVKTLDYVETLGSVSVIATDKTGTLTQNRMTASHLWYNGTITTATQRERGVPTYHIENHEFQQLFEVLCLNSRAAFDHGSSGSPSNRGGETSDDKVDPATRKVIGDASEAALLRFAATVADVSALRNAYSKVYEVPFNSVNKWQLSIHRYIKDGRMLTMKGAPEVVVTRCTTYLRDGQELPIDPAFHAEFDRAYAKLGNMGERVLGFARLILNPKKFGPGFDDAYDLGEKNFPTKGLCFVGFAALIDPPRETVPAAVAKCRSAGVKVIMITGDHPATALAIGKKVGIVTHPTAQELAASNNKKSRDAEAEAGAVVVLGKDVDDLDEEAWDRVLKHPDVIFARMSPTHKLKVVENLQRLKYTVAVTGDGVNDSPALKRADVGIAMGVTGSDVAKEAAAVVLMDDDFSSIVVGIEEGRLLFDNLRKTIAYQVTHCPGELWPTLLLIVLNLPLGMGPAILLMLDIGTEIPPSIALTYEPAESDIMNRPPRPSTEHLMTLKSLVYSYLEAGGIQLAACLTSYFYVFSSFGFSAADIWDTGATYWNASSPDLITRDGVVHTAAEQVVVLRHVWCAWFLAVVVTQFFNMLACKTRRVSIFTHGMRNMYLNAGLILELLIGAFVVYTPFMQDLLSSITVPFVYWVLPIPFGIVTWIFGESAKAWIRRHPEGFYARYIAW